MVIESLKLSGKGLVCFNEVIMNGLIFKPTINYLKLYPEDIPALFDVTIGGTIVALLYLCQQINV